MTDRRATGNGKGNGNGRSGGTSAAISAVGSCRNGIRAATQNISTTSKDIVAIAVLDAVAIIIAQGKDDRIDLGFCFAVKDGHHIQVWTSRKVVG